MAMVEERGISTVGEKEDLGLGDVVDEREDFTTCSSLTDWK